MMQLLQRFSKIVQLIYSENSSVSKLTIWKKKEETKEGFLSSISLILLVFASVFTLCTSSLYSQIRQADYYIDGINGNDSNNGTSPQTAWKTIDKLNSSLSSGNTYAIRDSIYYRRNSGSAGIDVSVSNIRITNWWPNANWRNGDKLPIIACSYKISNWTNVSGNIWQASGSGNNSLVFTYADSIKWGMARSSQGSLTKECDFYKSGSSYYVYSPTDPDTRYESIDANRLADGINNKGDNNMFDHLDVRYSTSNGMMFEPDGQYSTFRDSRIQYTGSSQGVLSGTGSEGVYMHATGSKCINNYIREHTHHSVFVYNTTGTAFSDITIDSNLVTNGHYNFFDMNGGTISGIKIRYNVAYEEDWAEYRQESNYTGRNGGFWTNGGVQDVLIAYNLVYNMYEAVLFDARVGQITAHNNTFVQTRSGGDGGMVVYSDGGSGSDWKNNILARNGGSVGSASGSNNISTTSLSSVGWQNWQDGNFRLTSGSSAINYGVNLGYTKDLDGNPIVGLPDAGAYEFSSGGGGNNPPNQPSNPSPSNGAANQPVNLSLSWTCSDPNGDPLTYDVYFGTNSNPPVVSTNQSANSFNPGQLTNSTTYYWKIVAKDNQGAFTTGSVWNFSTEAAGGGNNPPNQPANPNPASGSTNQGLNLNLSWTCSDPDGDPLTYDVYFGTNSNPPVVSTNQSANSFNPGQLTNSTTYYWKIVAEDNQGASTTGSVWNFTTESAGGDLTPPELLSAELQNLTTLKIIFSEPLEQSGAQNTNNYSITNDITVLAATLSGSEVTLTTTEHSEGTYTVTVSNVTDLAGNLIDPDNNTAEYEGLPSELIQLQIVEATASVVPEPEHAPEKTIDGMGYYQGDPDSRWAGDTMPEWLMYDIGEVKDISLVKLSFYNWNTGRIYTYTMQVSNDGIQWTDVLSNVTSALAEWTDNVFSSIQARYVRVNFISSNQNSWAGLWETQVWGPNTTTGNEDENLKIVTEYALNQNYPNPFNPSTTISFNLPANSHVRLAVYNLLGEQVAELVNSELQSGVHSFSFNALELTSGIYLYRIEANEFLATKKMILLK